MDRNDMCVKTIGTFSDLIAENKLIWFQSTDNFEISDDGITRCDVSISFRVEIEDGFKIKE